MNPLSTPETAPDALHLASVEGKLELIRDRVLSVAEGYRAGLYLWGEGGTSKSFTVETTLRQLGTPFKLTNSRVTGKGLFDLLRDFPDAVHMIEDAEPLLKDKNAFGVLRSALWGQSGPDGHQERTVCWSTAKSRDEFVFTGGIILVANTRLDDIPEARALKTRIPCLHYHLTNLEVAAVMRDIARKGYRWGPHHLSPEKCLEVAEVVIDQSDRLTRNLDLRMLINAFNDRLQFENGASETHWLDLMVSTIKERVTAPAGGYGVRAMQKSKEHEVLRSIAALPVAERDAAWKEETGKSPAAMYRRLKELNANGSHFSQGA